MSYREEAMQLIYFDADQNSSFLTLEYMVNNEALEVLKSVPSPIGVISVVGMYRTGKSYLMNRMILDRNAGFGVGPTVNPCTKGLWIWGSPIKG
jgi:hypothetical protein